LRAADGVDTNGLAQEVRVGGLKGKNAGLVGPGLGLGVGPTELIPSSAMKTPKPQ
jgi:hypothetical protein